MPRSIFPGTLAALGVIMALRHAEQTGEGQFLDVGMYDAIFAMCERAAYQYTFASVVAKPHGNEHPLFVPFGLFPCQDGWVSIACPNDQFWRRLAERIGHPELAHDERYATKAARLCHRELVNSTLSDWTAVRTKAQIAEFLGGHIPFGPVNTARDIISDSHVHARDMLWKVEHPGSGEPSTIVGTPIHLERTPGSLRHRAPYLSEHAEALLLELDFSASEIEEMRHSASVL